MPKSYAKHQPRGGAKKMMDAPMAGKKGLGHYEAHAKSMHERADGHISHPKSGHAARHHGAIKAGSGNQAHSSKKGLPNSAAMKNPAMGAGKGYGGY